MASLTISTIQTNIIWEDKLANLDLLQKKIESIEQRTEVVILPEMFSTGFSMNTALLSETMDGETVSWMKRISREKNIILTGSLIIEEENKFFNRLIWMMPNGQFGYYDKRHLFAFSEEDKYYSAGNKRLIASVKGWKLNMQICYDLRFPVWARQQLVSVDETLQPEYDVLVYVANWPERRSRAWKTLLSARAIENQCFVVGVNRVGTDGKGNYHSGDSLIINPVGEVQYHFADDEDVFTITLEKEILQQHREKLPFLKDADDFSILL